MGRIVVIGAGVGGLAAALVAAGRGCEVLVLERAAGPGGKLREIEIEGRRIDAGPTVLTMRDVFDDLFAEAGASFDDHIKLKRAAVLARHVWSDGSRLDLFSDVQANADAIGAFAGAAEARGYREFAARSAGILDTLENSFIRAARPGPLSLTRRVGLLNISRLLAISPFETLWSALGEHFRDLRLRQLFARYATYCGASPFLAPATLMLVAEVERRGVWYVEGGMRRLAEAMRAAAERAGARFRFGVAVARIALENGRARAVVTKDGERIEADGIVFNGDVSALGMGLLGGAAARAADATPPRRRSLSALTLVGMGRPRGFPLIRHNVFFGADYAGEFEAIFKQSRLPAEPTTYVCASDREDEATGEDAPERLFVLVNAPAVGARGLESEDLQSCESAAMRLMRRCGLTIEMSAVQRTGPAEFARLFPATGGALYGAASHGWKASFERMGARSRLPGLYLAGGSAHPGPGVPMAALSGRQAALTLISDLVSTRKFRRAAIAGGM